MLCIIENVGVKYHGPLSVESAKIYFSRTKGWPHVLNNQVFCNCSSVFCNCSSAKNWNRRKEQKAEELYEDGWWFFSRWTSVMVLKYTETGNVLWTIRGFQRQFPNQRTPCRQTIMNKNYNIKYMYFQYGLSLNRNIGKSERSCSETAFETYWLFPEHYRFLYTVKP